MDKRDHPMSDREEIVKPITMQDVRLAAGEGKLTPADVLAGCNAELKRRAALLASALSPSSRPSREAIEAAIYEHVGSKAHPWDTYREGPLLGVDRAASAILALSRPTVTREAIEAAARNIAAHVASVVHNPPLGRLEFSELLALEAETQSVALAEMDDLLALYPAPTLQGGGDKSDSQDPAPGIGSVTSGQPESIYLNLGAEKAAVKALGDDIGFGRIIQLSHECWDEMLDRKHGIKGHSEHWTLCAADLIRERRATTSDPTETWHGKLKRLVALKDYAGALALLRTPAPVDPIPSPPTPNPSLPHLARDEPNLCEDCPPVGYSTDKTRCLPCPRRSERGSDHE